jgi:hypothetical protein
VHVHNTKVNHFVLALPAIQDFWRISFGRTILPHANFGQTILPVRACYKHRLRGINGFWPCGGKGMVPIGAKLWFKAQAAKKADAVTPVATGEPAASVDAVAV